VDSMVTALNSWLAQHDFNELVIIGYSGGGVIAVLMADKIMNLSTVVTISANLNVSKWSEYHGYLPLKQSLNPADMIGINSNIKQIHFAGKEDEVVPLFIIKEYAEQQENVKFYGLSGRDHSCCWDEGWDDLLELIK